MFEYYFQILKNLKQDLMQGLNFQRMFKISQDITDDNDLYLHIRRKIVAFSQQAKNTTNHIKKKKKPIHCHKQYSLSSNCLDHVQQVDNGNAAGWCEE